MGFLDKNKIRIEELTRQVQEYLIEKYNASRHVFTPASPYGQIIFVLQNLVYLIFYYIEDAIVENNILTAQKESSIYGLSRLTGHNPTRPIAAVGEISLKLKTGAASEIESNVIQINNFTKIICKNNNLPYLIWLDSDNIKFQKTSTDKIYLRLIQGEIEEQTKIANGRPLQSYNFTSKKPIDNDFVNVYVNGQLYTKYESLYDMLKGTYSCIVKTGIGGGIDVYFGNEDYGTIPPNGAEIRVQYLNTNGFQGNLDGNPSSIQFKADDSAVGSLGEEIDINEFFIITVEKPIMFGTDSEPVEMTRLLAPLMSRSFVLANPSNYVHFLSRFNQFAFIEAYNTYNDDYIDDDNIVYLFLVPDINKKIMTNKEYYETDEDNFYLSADEKERIQEIIDQSGQQIMTAEIAFVDPVIKRYVLNIFLRIFDNYDETTIKEDIISRITEYFLSVKRRDKIPKSDIIAIIEDVPGVDSVNIKFVSEENEQAIRNGYYYKTTYQVDELTKIKTPLTTKIMLEQGQNPNLGLDEFGDVAIQTNELPLIRGGWDDRNGITYEIGVSYEVLSSINIVVKDVVINDINAKVAQTKRKNIK